VFIFRQYSATAEELFDAPDRRRERASHPDSDRTAARTPSALDRDAPDFYRAVERVPVAFLITKQQSMQPLASPWQLHEYRAVDRVESVRTILAGAFVLAVPVVLFLHFSGTSWLPISAPP